MTSAVILIIIFGIALGLITFFVLKSIIAPKKLSTLSDLIKQGKYNMATKVAKGILAKDPRNMEAHYLLGINYLTDNKPELALMELKTCNNIGTFGGMCPEIEFREKIAELFARFKQHEESLKEYLLLIKLAPNKSEYYTSAGELFEERNSSEKAMEYYRKATELNPNNSNAHYRLGLMLYRNKKLLEAKAELDMALRTNSNNYKAHYFLGRILKENHDHVAALLAFERAQRDPDIKIKALVERGGCFMSMNDFERAITELERAIKLSEDPASNEVLYARYFLGLAYEKNREIDKAIENWEKIYSKKPSFRDVAEKLSQYQDLRGDDGVKEYITSSNNIFMELCKAVTEAESLSIRDINEIPNGCQIIAVENESQKWRNARKMPKLIRFLRVPELINESTVRSLHEEMKKLNISRGLIYSSSNFSRKAVEYAETRPINLNNAEMLQEALKNVNISQILNTQK